MKVSSTTGVPGKLASLKVNYEYPATESVCFLRFWYYMHTDLTSSEPNVDIGNLMVYLEGMDLLFISL